MLKIITDTTKYLSFTTGQISIVVQIYAADEYHRTCALRLVTGRSIEQNVGRNVPNQAGILDGLICFDRTHEINTEVKLRAEQTGTQTHGTGCHGENSGLYQT